IDYAARDRRWTQGNLQHARLLGFPGLHPLSRVHFLTGILSYVSSLMWLALLLVSSLVSAIETTKKPQYFLPDPHTLPQWPQMRAGETAVLFALTLAVLLLPKILGTLLTLRDRHLRRQFGGAARLCLSLLVEQFFSVLLAPSMMLFHSTFVAQTLLGKAVSWSAQDRSDRGVTLREAFRRQKWHLAFGVAWGAIMLRVAPHFFWWLTPVLVGLICGVGLSAWTSRTSAGRIARRWGLLLLAELLDPETHGIPGLEIEGLRLLPETDPRRRAGGDEVSGLEREEAADIADERGHTEEHRARIAGLHTLTVYIEPQVEILHVSDLIARDEPRTDRAKRVTAFALVPGAAELQLELALRDVVDQDIACDVFQGSIFFDVLLGRSNDHNELDLPVGLVRVPRNHHIVARSLQTAAALHEDHGLGWNGCIRLHRVVGIIQADGDELAGAHAGRAQPRTAWDRRQRGRVDRGEPAQAGGGDFLGPDIADVAAEGADDSVGIQHPRLFTAGRAIAQQFHDVHCARSMRRAGEISRSQGVDWAPRRNAASALYLARDEAIFGADDASETPDVWSGAGRNEVRVPDRQRTR